MVRDGTDCFNTLLILFFQIQIKRLFTLCKFQALLENKYDCKISIFSVMVVMIVLVIVIDYLICNELILIHSLENHKHDCS